MHLCDIIIITLIDIHYMRTKGVNALISAFNFIALINTFAGKKEDEKLYKKTSLNVYIVLLLTCYIFCSL